MPPPKRVVLNVLASNRLRRLATSATPFADCRIATGAAVGIGGGDGAGGVGRGELGNKPPMINLLNNLAEDKNR